MNIFFSIKAKTAFIDFIYKFQTERYKKKKMKKITNKKPHQEKWLKETYQWSLCIQN